MVVTTKDVVKATVSALKTIEGAKVKSTDFKKNVEKGVFYVEYPLPTHDGKSDFIHETGTIRIVYFPQKEEYREELAAMQLKLRAVFSCILTVTEDFVIPIHELRFEESDGALITSFDYEMYQLIEESGENMEFIFVEE